MTKTILAIFCAIAGLSVAAQYNPTPNTIDSLIQLVTNTKDDSTKFELFMQLGLAYGSVNVDKSVQHFNESYKLAKLFKDKNRTMSFLLTLGYTYSQIGQSAKAIEMLQEALHYTEETKTDPSMALAFLGINYEAQGDLKNALDYTRKSFLIFESGLKNKTIPFDEIGYDAGPMKMGAIFEKLNQLDSAYYYAQLSYQRILKYPAPAFYCEVCNLLGTINSRLNHHEEAIRFYQLALSKALEVNFPSSIQESQLALVNFFIKQACLIQPFYILYKPMKVQKK